jgi:hypothetical protein
MVEVLRPGETNWKGEHCSHRERLPFIERRFTMKKTRESPYSRKRP